MTSNISSYKNQFEKLGQEFVVIGKTGEGQKMTYNQGILGGSKFGHSWISVVNEGSIDDSYRITPIVQATLRTGYNLVVGGANHQAVLKGLDTLLTDAESAVESYNAELLKTGSKEEKKEAIQDFKTLYEQMYSAPNGLHNLSNSYYTYDPETDFCATNESSHAFAEKRDKVVKLMKKVENYACKMNSTHSENTCKFRCTHPFQTIRSS